jgi:hypothetical protein
VKLSKLYQSLALASIALLPACQSPAKDSKALPLPPQNPERIGEISAADAEQATSLYKMKCARCHKFYSPADYTDSEWNGWMKKMSKKARLTAPQKDLLSRFLDTFRPSPKGDAAAKTLN